MKKKYFFILCLFFDQVVYGQQWGSSYAQHYRDIYSVVIFNPQNITISGGHDYTDALEGIFHSDDFGLTWLENPTDTISFVVRSITFSDTMHGFGSGFFGNFVRTSDGGVTWLRDTLPINRNFFKAVYATPSKAFLAGGEELGNNMQTILKSTNGCNSWNVVRDTAGPVLRSLCFIDSVKGCAVGDTGTILRTVDGGNTWISIASPVQFNFNSITFINADTGYIVGGQHSLDSIQVILRTVDGGINWSVLQNQLGGWLTDISFLNKDTGYIVGYLNTFLETTDGGQTWVLQTVTSAIGAQYFTSVRFYNAGFGIIGSLFGTVFVYSNAPVPEVKTGNAVFGVLNSQPTLTLTGMVNTHDSPANISFIIGTDSLFSAMFETPYPSSVTSTAFVPTSYDITAFSLAPGTYFFACKITNTNGTYYGDTAEFIIPDSAAVLTAMPYTNGSGTSLTLHGQVNRLPAGANLYFEYSIVGDNVIHTVAAIPPIINDTISHNDSANITGIIPNLLYQYRIKATSGADIFYSDYLTFNLSGTNITATTSPATNISFNSATLHGQVSGLPLPSSVWFEYVLNGITTTVSAVPASINDNLPHNVSAQINGLMSDSLYQYRLKVIIDSASIIYGNYDIFYTNDSTTGNITVSTSPATNVTYNSATLNGQVGGLPLPSTLWFEYVLNGVTTTVAAAPASVNDTLVHYVSAQLNALMADSTYQYRLKVIINSSITLYGNYNTFYTGNTSWGFQTLLATAVTSTSAQLNGQVNALLFPTGLSFEYGTSQALGNIIVASPNNVNDTLEHPVSAALSGLIPNTIYYYRLKGAVSADTIFYGNIEQLYTADCEIPNCDFEIWDTTLAELPAIWNALGEVSRVPSYNGTNAVQITGAIILGSLRQGPGLSGGCPFPARPDSIMFYARYNIAIGDTAFAIVSFSLNGVPINQQRFPITGSSGGNFVLKKYKITFTTNAVPDSLALGFMSSNPNSANPMNPNSILAVDDISFAGTNLTVPNNNFELWETIVGDRPQGWMANFGDFFATPLFEPVVKTTDHVSGNYALLLHTDPSISYKPVFIVSGPQMTFNQPTFAVGARHTTLNGFVKYLPQNGDTLAINIYMYLHGVQIGTAIRNIDTAITNYSPFTIIINYPNNTTIPDSASITISVGGNNAHGNSWAYMDNLSFDGFRIVGINEPIVTDVLPDMLCKIYPNPATGHFTVEYLKESGDKDYLKVYDLCGKLLYGTELMGQPGKMITEIDLQQIVSGLYLVSIQSGTSIFTGKLLIQR